MSFGAGTWRIELTVKLFHRDITVCIEIILRGTSYISISPVTPAECVKTQ